MKKLLFSAALLCAVLCGCGVTAEKSVSPESLQLSFTCPAELCWRDTSYPCQISHTLTQQTKITLTPDGPLNGLTFCREDGQATVSYGSLSSLVQPSGFPAESPFLLVSDALDLAQSYVHLEDTGNNTFSMVTEGGTFQLCADETGAITSLSMGEVLSVTFHPQEQR
ncbi:MAG: hypothetical protein PUC32_06165 [Oscillospiraceae bacterium]|nr:hypothetical protein [Oscillospiraceae bacterium]